MNRRSILKGTGVLAAGAGSFALGRVLTRTPHQTSTFDPKLGFKFRQPVHFVPEPLDVRKAQPDLKKILLKMVPTNSIIATLKVHAIVHQLRLWGTQLESSRADPDPSGTELLAILLDDQKYKAYFNLGDESLIRDSDFGVSVWIGGGFLAEPHVDKILSICGEMSLTLDWPIKTSTRGTTLKEMLCDSIMRFSLNQSEIAWSLIAYSSYFDGLLTVANKFNKSFTVDSIARKVMASPFSDGTCFGTHNLYSLAYVLHVDSIQPVVSPTTRRLIHLHLDEAASRLEKSQYATGLWAMDWFKPVDYNRNAMHHPTIATKNLVRATGHHLEWLMFAPHL